MARVRTLVEVFLWHPQWAAARSTLIVGSDFGNLHGEESENIEVIATDMWKARIASAIESASVADDRVRNKRSYNAFNPANDDARHVGFIRLASHHIRLTPST